MNKKIKILGKLDCNLKKMINYHKLEDKRFIAFFLDYSSLNIPINSFFTYIEGNNSKEELNLELVYITNELNFPLELIEIGYKTIGVFFIHKNSKMLDEIPVVISWYDDNISNYLLSNSPSCPKSCK